MQNMERIIQLFINWQVATKLQLETLQSLKEAMEAYKGEVATTRNDIERIVAKWLAAV
jgi:hypothetical protein